MLLQESDWALEKMRLQSRAVAPSPRDLADACEIARRWIQLPPEYWPRTPLLQPAIDEMVCHMGFVQWLTRKFGFAIYIALYDSDPLQAKAFTYQIQISLRVDTYRLRKDWGDSETNTVIHGIADALERYVIKLLGDEAPESDCQL